MEEEWWGYNLGANGDRDDVEAKFVENIRFAEFWCRKLGKRGSLAQKLDSLFDELPLECQTSISDNRTSLIKEFVRARNRFAHGDFLSPRIPPERMLVLVTKLGILLFYSDALHTEGPEFAKELADRASPRLKTLLTESDNRPSPLASST